MCRCVPHAVPGSGRAGPSRALCKTQPVLGACRCACPCTFSHSCASRLWPVVNDTTEGARLARHPSALGCCRVNPRFPLRLWGVGTLGTRPPPVTSQNLLPPPRYEGSPFFVHVHAAPVLFSAFRRTPPTTSSVQPSSNHPAAHIHCSPFRLSPTTHIHRSVFRRSLPTQFQCSVHFWGWSPAQTRSFPTSQPILPPATAHVPPRLRPPSFPLSGEWRWPGPWAGGTLSLALSLTLGYTGLMCPHFS